MQFIEQLTVKRVHSVTWGGLLEKAQNVDAP